MTGCGQEVQISQTSRAYAGAVDDKLLVKESKSYNIV